MFSYTLLRSLSAPLPLRRSTQMPDEAAAVDEVALMTRGWTWPYDESANGAEQTASTREPSNSIDELMSRPAAAAQEQEKQALQELQRRSNDTDESIETDEHDDTAKHADDVDAAPPPLEHSIISSFPSRFYSLKSRAQFPGRVVAKRFVLSL